MQISEPISSSYSLPDFIQNLSMFFTIKSRHFSERDILLIWGILIFKEYCFKVEKSVSNFLYLQLDKKLTEINLSNVSWADENLWQRRNSDISHT